MFKTRLWSIFSLVAAMLTFGLFHMSDDSPSTTGQLTEAHQSIVDRVLAALASGVAGVEDFFAQGLASLEDYISGRQAESAADTSVAEVANTVPSDFAQVTEAEAQGNYAGNAVPSASETDSGIADAVASETTAAQSSTAEATGTGAPDQAA